MTGSCKSIFGLEKKTVNFVEILFQCQPLSIILSTASHKNIDIKNTFSWLNG